MKKLSKSGILLAIVAVLTLAQPAAAQEKSELGVARISLTNGEVTTRRGDSGDWVEGRVNLPLVEGDSIATGRASRAEVQLDSANFVRLNESTELSMAQLGNRQFRIQVLRGIVTYSELKGGEADVDIETPHVSVRPLKRGNYRVEVTEAGETIVTVRSGEAEIASRQGRETLKSGRMMIVRGPQAEAEFQLVKATRRDDWDYWNERRDKQLQQSVSRRYVSSDIYGVEDLDDHGRWQYVSGYGYSWFPRVSAGWAPYRHGRWSYLDYYGWSWVGYEPWGWAPYHYGRWYQHASYGWGWYPGHRYGRHHWRPALVAFFGYNSYSGFSVGLNFGFGHIGWVPLAPYEPYYPWYGRSHGYGRGGYGYGRGGGVHNTSIYIDNSTNIYTNYRNARARNGVSLVDAESFSQGRVNAPRSLRAAELRRATLMRGQIPVVPARQSRGRVVRASNTSAAAGTASSLRRSSFFSRQPSRQPAARTSFDQQRQNMTRSLRAFADANGRRTATARAAGTPGAAASRPAGGVRAGTTGSRSAALGGGSASGSVRAGGARSAPARTGNPSPSGSPAASRGGVRATGGQTAQWRRFGRSRTGAVSANGNSGRPPASARSGSPRTLAASPSRARASRLGSGSAGSSGQSWRRFGGNSRIRSSSAQSRASRPRVSGSARARGNGSKTSSFTSPRPAQGGTSGTTRRVAPRTSSRIRSSGGSSGSSSPRTFSLPRPVDGNSVRRGGGGFVPRSRSRAAQPGRSGAPSVGGGSRAFTSRSNSRVSSSSGSRSYGPPSAGRSIPRSRSAPSRVGPRLGGSSRVSPSAGRSRSFGGFGGGSRARSAAPARSSGGFGGSSAGRAPSIRSGGGIRSAPSRGRGGSVSRSGGASRAPGGSRSSGRGSFGRR